MTFTIEAHATFAPACVTFLLTCVTFVLTAVTLALTPDDFYFLQFVTYRITVSKFFSRDERFRLNNSHTYQREKESTPPGA